MSRILAIDYGTKRTGLAWTDSARIFASRLPGCATADLLPTLDRLIAEGPVSLLVLGFPTHFDGSDTDATPHIRKFAEQLSVRYPNLKLVLEDERMTSRLAVQSMLEAGVRKKQRQDKLLVDSQAATLLLQHYLEKQPNA